MSVRSKRPVVVYLDPAEKIRFQESARKAGLPFTKYVVRCLQRAESGYDSEIDADPAAVAMDIMEEPPPLDFGTIDDFFDRLSREIARP
jgi:hypothetical protein